MDRLFEITGKDFSASFSGRDLPLRIGGRGSHIPLPQLRQDACLIGEIDGYLFLQPISERVDIFHNHERIKGSVWIKSGDETRIGKTVISYRISGDIVFIAIGDAGEAKERTGGRKVPAAEKRTSPLPRVNGEERRKRSTPLWVKLSVPALLVLVLAALFLLVSECMEISVSPAPDSLDVSGFPPAVRIGKRYLAVPGRYKVSARKEGYAPLEADIVLGRTGQRFGFTLVPLPGLVDITTLPESNATIRLDGRLLGVTPLTDLEVQGGNHTLEISRERYRKIEEKILVAGKGIHQHFSFTLQPAWGRIRLSSSPEGADILVDGKDMGRKTPASLELTEGMRRILLRKAGFRPGKLEVKVKAGKEISPPPVVLEHAPGILKIETVPKGAMATVDGRYAGKTPLRLEVKPEKAHEISVSLKGHKPGKKKLSIGPGKSRTIRFTLEPLYCTVFITSPSGTTLFIDGKRQEKNSGSFRLTAAPHAVEIREPSGKRQTRRITPLPGSTLTLDMRIQPSRANPAGFRSRTSGQKFVLFQPATGPFTMGSSRREPGRLSNEARRKVMLTRPFYMSTTEVTNAQFRRFDPEHSSGSFRGIGLDGGSQPVANVTWVQAVRYLNWLSVQDGLEPFYKEKDGKVSVVHPLTNGYRLPTEAEWAWAARFAKRSRASRYPWAGRFPPPPRAGNFADESARDILPAVITGYNDSFPVSSPVGSFGPNPAGLLDMGGNVAEWCHDFYSPVPATGGGMEKDPLGPASGTHHVVRGSSWKSSSITELRLSYRGYSRKARADIGFRIARYAR